MEKQERSPRQTGLFDTPEIRAWEEQKERERQEVIAKREREKKWVETIDIFNEEKLDCEVERRSRSIDVKINGEWFTYFPDGDSWKVRSRKGKMRESSGIRDFMGQADKLAGWIKKKKREEREEEQEKAWATEDHKKREEERQEKAWAAEDHKK